MMLQSMRGHIPAIFFFCFFFVEVIQIREPMTREMQRLMGRKTDPAREDDCMLSPFA